MSELPNVPDVFRELEAFANASPDRERLAPYVQSLRRIVERSREACSAHAEQLNRALQTYEENAHQLLRKTQEKASKDPESVFDKPVRVLSCAHCGVDVLAHRYPGEDLITCSRCAPGLDW